MAEQEAVQDVTQRIESPLSNAQPEATPAAAENTESPAEHMVPKSRFNEVYNRMRELEAAQVKAEKERQEEEQKRLAEQQQWKELAERHAAKIDEMTPALEQFDALREWAAQHVEQLIAEWPDEVKAMRPADADPLTLLRWTETARPLAEKLMQPGSAPGNAPGPKPNSRQSDPQAEAERRRAFERSIRTF